MNGPEKMAVYIAAIIASAACILVVGSMLAFNQRMRIMAENGLCEQTPRYETIGSSVWGKK